MANLGAQIGNNTRNIIEKITKHHPSLKNLLNASSSYSQGISNLSSNRITGGWIKALSSMANVVVGQCARVLMVTPEELESSFNEEELPESSKDPSCYARNLLEFCCFRAIAVAVQSPDHLKDKNFRRWTFDMFLAWESPSSDPSFSSNEESNACLEAYVRLAPAVPLAADSITVYDQFEILTASTGGRLPFDVYNKFLAELDKAIKTIKSHSSSSLCSTLGIKRQERIIETDGIATQPVLQHVGVAAWPGRLTLTDCALYFEPSGVVSYDNAKRFDLSADLKHSIKPDLTGPMGARLFDKAVMYKSSATSEPIVLEFPELIGHSRRDYWLSIIREIISVRTFVRNAKLESSATTQALTKSVLGIARLKAIWSLQRGLPTRPERLLTFISVDEMPGGDLVFRHLASILRSDDSPSGQSQQQQSQQSERDPNSGSDASNYRGSGAESPRIKLPSPSSPSSPSHFFKSGSTGTGAVSSGQGDIMDSGLTVGRLVVGELSALDKAVIRSRDKFMKVAHAQSTVQGVKVDGIDTNLAILKELCIPLTLFGSCILSLAEWKEPVKSFTFLLFVTYITYRNWLCYVIPTLLFVNATVILYLRYAFRGERNSASKRNELVVVAPPNKNAVEQLVILQQSLQNVEAAIQHANIALLKARALLLSELPQATDELLAIHLVLAFLLGVVPFRILFLVVFLDAFTRQMECRKEGTRRLIRRIKEWWFHIPVVPVRFINKDK